LTVQAAYTYSKSLATAFFNDQTAAPQWTIASINRPQRLSLSYFYVLPSPTGNPFAHAVLGDWSFSGVTTIQSGTPMTLTDATTGSIYGRSGTGTATLCPGKTNADLATTGRDQGRLNSWFGDDPTGSKGIICAPPGWTSGNKTPTGYGNTSQNIVNGPGQFNWDMSLTKLIRVGGIREDARLQFRTEFYNAFNHPQFNNPGSTYTFGVPSSAFGRITSESVSPRLIQFGLKYIF
jgi:hypothetical protein